MTGKNRSLSRSALIGTGWLLAQNMGTRAISFGAQIILAKLLAPSDFGAIGLALTVTTLANVIANFGVDDVLLQRQKTLRFWASSGFSASLGLGLLSFLAVVAIAPFVASLYRAPVLLSLLPLMALSMPLTALSTVPMAKIRADLNFRFLAAYTTAELAFTQLLTIGLALVGMGVYSFAIPVPVMALVRAVVFWFAARPRLGRIRLKQLRMMGSNSAAVFGTKILTAAVGQGDYFVLGLFATRSVVGAYFFAFRLAIQPVQLLAGNLSNVLFPILSQLRNEPQRQKEAAI
ncbi:MAG TPA: oligosaccharide flippase family protein, partial [Rhizomicrobium sp.]|nr:oligosaccharide flippase family protein [Rhizomicrobium sp.]